METVPVGDASHGAPSVSPLNLPPALALTVHGIFRKPEGDRLLASYMRSPMVAILALLVACAPTPANVTFDNADAITLGNMTPVAAKKA